MVQECFCLPPEWFGDEGFPADAECSCGLSVAPYEHHRPGCDRAAHPYLDVESLTLVEDALASLVSLRDSVRGGAGAVFACLASLIAEAQSRLPDAVADARSGERTWAQIAAWLGTTATTVRRRHGAYARWRAGVAREAD